MKRPFKQPSLGAWVVECAAIGLGALLAAMLALGQSAAWFSQWHVSSHFLPFLVGISLWAGLGAGFLWLWRRLRHRLLRHLTLLPATVASSLALLGVWFVLHGGHDLVFQHFRELVGSKQQLARVTLEHQIYAAYRRHDDAQVRTMMQRSVPFRASIEDAARAFDLDVYVLQGIAATESSFLPRDSRDGGHGLFQITAVSKESMARASQRLGAAKLDVNDPRHNAFMAAAALQQYIKDMQGDLFLGLLAYNIGPRNGGLRFIMQQYGAHDFVTIQPYLQQLPRDYPIRVLAYALAFRLWQHDGQLPAYETGDNASYIQRLGIPGLSLIF